MAMKHVGLGSKLGPLLVATLGHFLVDFMVGIWPIYKTLLNLDLAKAGMIVACCATLGEAMQMVFGPWADHGRRKTLILFGVLCASTAGFFSLTRDYAVLTGMLLLTYVGSAAFHPSGGSLAHAISDRKNRGLFMGIFAAGGALGLALSQVVYSSLFTYFGSQVWVVVLPSLALVVVGLLQCIPEAQPVKGSRPSLTACFRLFKVPELRLLYFGQVMNQAFYWGCIFLLPDVLKERQCAPWLYAGGGHLAMMSGVAMMMVPVGLLADRLGPKRVMISLQLLGLAILYSILLQPLMSVGLLLLGLFILGACIGSMNPVGVVYGNQLFPGYPGLMTAFIMGCVWLVAEGVGMGLGGALTSVFQENPAAKSLAVLGIGMLGSLTLNSRLPSMAQPEPLESEGAARP